MHLKCNLHSIKCLYRGGYVEHKRSQMFEESRNDRFMALQHAPFHGKYGNPAVQLYLGKNVAYSYT